ncbi:MAG: glycosyltransferase family 4 protein [Bacteroidales bacterium]|nr:glycosyltransferase family 4 protein [Bacteroidales bacterium]
MRVIYFSYPFFADCDFPLIKELQGKGVDVRCYIPIDYGFQKSSILEFNTPFKKWGIYRASKIKEMQLYKDCIDLNRLFFIAGKNSFKNPTYWLLWICVVFHMLFQRAEVIHITWQLSGMERILMYIPFFKKKIMTVHDPIQHSNIPEREKKEKLRRRCFKWADSFILLNQQQVKEFSKTYGIPEKSIYVSKLGAYDSITHMNLPNYNLKSKNRYIIFFGQITPHKGVEYLLSAMIRFHSEFPDVNLIIAGGGRLYFDAEPYSNLDYIQIENRYVGIRELVPLVRNALFSVCPYIDATQSGVVQTSLALNVPVVATNVGALAEMVKDGKYGKIVPPCDSGALFDAMVEMLKTPDVIEQMKDNIKNQWSLLASWSPIADIYKACYSA